MHVLVACETSGVVREAFRALGHDAWSCDVLPPDDGSEFHIQADAGVIAYAALGWDLMIAHPPCTRLAVSGARWFALHPEEQARALDFVRLLMNAPIKRICIENPVSVISTKIRKPDQIIQPYQFGDRARKTTCLWLKGLPLLVPTCIVEPELYVCANGKTFSKDYIEARSRDRRNSGKLRSRTYPGVANAMAQQWGSV